MLNFVKQLLVKH